MIDSPQSSFIIPKYLPGPSKVRCCTKSSWVFPSMGGVSPYFHRTSVQEASSDRAWGVSPDSGGNCQVPSTHPSLGGKSHEITTQSVRMLCAQPCGWSQAPQELGFFSKSHGHILKKMADIGTVWNKKETWNNARALRKVFGKPMIWWTSWNFLKKHLAT